MKIGEFIEYKNYTGSIEYNPESKNYYGSLLNTKDYVNYIAKDIMDLEKEFHNAVDVYIEFLEGINCN